MTNTTLPDRLLAEIRRRRFREFTAAQIRDGLPPKERPTLTATKAALGQLWDQGLLYLLPPAPTSRRGRPRARRWRVVTAPLSADRAREAVIAEWIAWAKDPSRVNGPELVGLIGMLQIKHPHLLAWPLEPGWDRESYIATWVTQWSRSAEAQAAVEAEAAL